MSNHNPIERRNQMNLISEQELLELIASNLKGWAKEEADENDDCFADRLEDTCVTFREALEKHINAMAVSQGEVSHDVPHHTIR